MQKRLTSWSSSVNTELTHMWYIFIPSHFAVKKKESLGPDLFWLLFWPSNYHLGFRFLMLLEFHVFCFWPWLTQHDVRMIVQQSLYSKACVLSLTHYLPGLWSMPKARRFSLWHVVKPPLCKSLGITAWTLSNLLPLEVIPDCHILLQLDPHLQSFISREIYVLNHFMMKHTLQRQRDTV